MMVLAPAQSVARISGQWTGFSNEGSSGRRKRLDLLLQIHGNQLSGLGNDDQGMFVVSGTFDPGEQECHWVQTYLGGQTYRYRGFCDADSIWGTWQDSGEGHGGFHIRPVCPHAGMEAVASAA